MDIGTILLIAAIVAGILDTIILLVGPRIENYSRYSFITSLASFLAAVGVLLWLGTLIFMNQFQYAYVYQITSVDTSFLLKISALWTGQSGTLVFWTFLSFAFYFGYRLVSRGYEDDKLVKRAAIIMRISSLLVAVSALVSDPFRLIIGTVPTDGLGLNPILATIWNVIHPPIIFIAYAVIIVPFSVKLAGFTIPSEERGKEAIPVVDAYVRFTTILAWLMLSAGIAIGGYWAYIVIGYGGYWAWDPIETTCLIPWLLITAYYHAKPIFSKNDVFRDSFLVMSYVSIFFAAWATRSGVLSSVHGYGMTAVSSTMLVTLLFTLILGVGLTLYVGYRDMPDDDTSDIFGFFKEKNIRLLSIKIAFIGLLIVTTTSIVGVAYPATYNFVMLLIDPANFADNQIAIKTVFFQYGLYAASAFLIASAFYCLRPTYISIRNRGFIMLSLFVVGGILAGLTVFGGFGPLPTNFWFANLLVLPAVGAIAFLAIAFIRQMFGKDKIVSTRELGRLILHLGLIILLLGVFMSENIVYESNGDYMENDTLEIAPGIYIQVTDIQMENFVDDTDYTLLVTIQVIEIDISNTSRILGIGNATITSHPSAIPGRPPMTTHQVYIQSDALRDVYVAVTDYSPIAPNEVTIDTKILPLVSFVWLGAFLMISAMLPMLGMEVQALYGTFKGRGKDLYEDVSEDTDEPVVENQNR